MQQVEASGPVYQRILLTLDGSVLAEKALPHAIAQANCFGAKLILLKVIQPLLEARTPKREKWAASQVYKELTPAAEQARRAGIEVEIVCIEGGGGTGPALTIVRYAAQNAIDLIVISARGHGGFKRWVLGSTADGVVRKATVPVFLVRAGEEDDDYEAWLAE
jgi:nucleotide-binding universal stress UspA family protein